MFEAAGAEIRAGEIGGMTIAFYTLPAGVDARPLLQGPPGGACHCPLEPTEMFEVSPTQEARDVWQHLQQLTGANREVVATRGR